MDGIHSCVKILGLKLGNVTNIPSSLPIRLKYIQHIYIYVYVVYRYVYSMYNIYVFSILYTLYIFCELDDGMVQIL